MMIELHAHILGQGDRAGKTLLPPHTTKRIRTTELLNFAGRWLSVSTERLALRSISVISEIIEPSETPVEVLLHNSGWEHYYVAHEELIARLIELPAEPYGEM